MGLRFYRQGRGDGLDVLSFGPLLPRWSLSNKLPEAGAQQLQEQRTYSVLGMGISERRNEYMNECPKWVRECASARLSDF